MFTIFTAAAKSLDRQFVEIFVCFFCEKEFSEKTELQRHQRKCKGRPPELCSVSTRSRRPAVVKRNWSYMYKPPQKRDFFESLGLVSLSKADVIRQRTDSKAHDFDVEVIDLEDPTFEQIPTPSKSPRPIFCRRASGLIKVELPENDNDKHLSDSECSKSDAGSEIEYHPRKSVSLLSIDVTSVLGQRVKKHVKLPGVGGVDNSDEVFDDNLLQYERFCRTPVKAKSGFVRRLRQRGNVFPVTFRKTRHTLPPRAHMYKFSRRQQRENYRRLETGLDARSRALKRSMRRYHVILERLTAKQMRRWMSRPAPTLKVTLSPLTPGEIACWCTPEKGQPSIFPSTPDRLSLSDPVMQGVLGLKTRMSPLQHRQRRLTLSQLVSEDVNAEVLQQKAIVYRTVLSELGAGGGDGSNPADLTPPDTPKDGSVDDCPSNEHDLQGESAHRTHFGDGSRIAPNENTHPKHTPEIGKGVLQMTGNCCKSGKVVRNSRQTAALRTLVGCRENAMAGDAAAAAATESQTPSPMLSRSSNGASPARSGSAIPSVLSKRNVTNGNIAKVSLTQAKRCLAWDGSRVNTKQSSARRVVLPSPQADDVVLISDDEAAEAVPSARGKRRRSAVDRDEMAKKRMRSGESRAADMLFNCHLCGDAITFNDDVQTYITRHFLVRHGVPNIHLMTKVGTDGRRVVTIVEGSPSPPKLNYRSMDRPLVDAPQRHLANKTAVQLAPAPMSLSNRRLTRRNSVPASGITTRAGTMVRGRQTAPVVNFICID